MTKTDPESPVGQAGTPQSIHWLRQRKQIESGADVPHTAMPAVRRALGELRELDLGLSTENDEPRVAVDRNGEIHLQVSGGLQALGGSRPLDPDLLDLIRSFATVGMAFSEDHAGLRLVNIFRVYHDARNDPQRGREQDEHPA